MKARVMRAVGAHSFGMALTIVIQLASLPLFLTRWGVETYGVWLIISAIPSYLAMTDIGMVTVAGNRMMMALGRGDREEANRVFQSARLFVCAACLVVIVLGTLALQFAPLPADAAGARSTIALLGASVLVSLFGGLSEQVFRANGRSATAALAGNMCRMADWPAFA